MPTSQPKVIRDSNADFQINQHPDPDVRQITPKMSWIHYLVAKFRNNRAFTKFPQFRNGEENGKVT